MAQRKPSSRTLSRGCCPNVPTYPSSAVFWSGRSPCQMLHRHTPRGRSSSPQGRRRCSKPRARRTPTPPRWGAACRPKRSRPKRRATSPAPPDDSGDPRSMTPARRDAASPRHAPRATTASGSRRRPRRCVRHGPTGGTPRDSESLGLGHVTSCLHEGRVSRIGHGGGGHEVREQPDLVHRSLSVRGVALVKGVSHPEGPASDAHLAAGVAQPRRRHGHQFQRRASPNAPKFVRVVAVPRNSPPPTRRERSNSTPPTLDHPSSHPPAFPLWPDGAPWPDGRRRARRRHPQAHCFCRTRGTS